MSRVVRPGSSSVPQKPSQTGAAPKPRVIRPGAKVEKPRIAKPGGTTGEDVEQAHQAENSHQPHDSKEAHEAAHATHGWTPDAHAEEKKDAREEVHESEERKEQGEAQSKGFAPANKGASGTGQHQARPQLQGKRDGFESQALKGGQQASDAKQVQGKVITGVHAAAQIGNEAALKHPSQPDAFTLLHQAKEKGVYFKEDEHGDGPESGDDPELQAAVEEAIRLLFGVRGVMRVGPGQNEAGEKVVVIVANQGFGEGSMLVVPEKVHKFPTLLALPYDLLPLKKER